MVSVNRELALLFVALLTLSCVARGDGMVVASRLHQGECDDNEMHPVPSALRAASRHQLAHRDRRAAMPKVAFIAPDLERDGDYWQNRAQDVLRRQLQKNTLNKNVAKNIILFLGDGMSIPTLSAARIYMGGEEKELSFEAFPFSGLSKTYCANTQVADSACTATAYLGGVKGNYATIGLTASVPLNDCPGQNNTGFHVASIAKWAQDYGMSTGLITTTQVTHASPAGVYAHIANRNWESNQQLVDDGGDPRLCSDIAMQLVHGDVGKKLKVVLGGGRQEFLTTAERDSEGASGKRTDGRNLINEWEDKHRRLRQNAQFVQTKEQLLNLNESTEYVLGLFSSSHMPYNIEKQSSSDKPSLEEMVDAALDILERDKKGFFLFVEGGRIDHGHHDGHAARALDETVEFSKAIDLARKRTSDESTLIVVTSDHSHTMSISGYSSRGNNVLGINDGQNGDDNLPYATLNYANGPGHRVNMNLGGRQNLNKLHMEDNDYTYPSLVPLASSTHGGDDVAVFANGPWSHLFSGTYEQNYIPHAMAYAACIGKGLSACQQD